MLKHRLISCDSRHQLIKALTGKKIRRFHYIKRNDVTPHYHTLLSMLFLSLLWSMYIELSFSHFIIFYRPLQCKWPVDIGLKTANRTFALIIIINCVFTLKKYILFATEDIYL